LGYWFSFKGRPVQVLESSVSSNVNRAIKIKEDVQDEACSTHGCEQKCIGYWWPQTNDVNRHHHHHVPTFNNKFFTKIKQQTTRTIKNNKL
jgi:hypothetical protein